MDGVNSFKLEVTLGTGNKMTLFVDPASFHVIREELPIQVNGSPGVIEEVVGNYRRFGPVTLACLFVTRQKGADEKDSQQLEFDSVELNPAVEDLFFWLPAQP